MENITVKDIVKATGGFLLCGDEDTPITGLCIDSRKAQPGDLFIPLLGNKVDGHRFIESAMEKASATLTSEHDNVVISEKPFIRVDDTMKALQAIGMDIRDRYDIPYIGVTGSVGKTTTREMIAAAVSTAKRCFQTNGNENSQIGVPMTLSRMTDGYDAAVIEMGISEPGQMEILSEIVKPSICVVTIIGVAHIEFMKTQENIRKEKLSIINHMNKDGLLLLNGDAPLLREIKADMPCRTLTFGIDEICDFQGSNVKCGEQGMEFDCTHNGETVHVTMDILGKHNVRNALAGIAVAYQMGIPITISAKAFEHFEGQRQRLIHMENRYTILDDTYNASPDSMKASIDVLCDMDCEGKKIAVLGDMFELGADSASYHYQIGEYLRDKKIDEVVVVGKEALEIKKALDVCDTKYAKTFSFMDNEEVALYLMAIMRPEDVVLIKGSHGMKMDEIVKILTN